jgi:cell division septum initiation protein DivIVA
MLTMLRTMVAEARNVPLSASCMLNRAEMLTVIDETMQALGEDLAEANSLTEKSQETLLRAQREADQIVAAAEEKAKFLANQTHVLLVARRKAAQLESRAIAEAEALRREADAYVDSRIAGMEAGLQKTMTQIKTMRARLASRSGLDAGETTTLPRITTE